MGREIDTPISRRFADKADDGVRRHAAGDRKQLELSDPVGKYLPQFKGDGRKRSRSNTC